MSNDIVIEAWNTVLFDKFSRFKYLFVEGYASISQEILSRELFAPGERVLDVGCGFGDCSIARTSNFFKPMLNQTVCKAITMPFLRALVRCFSLVLGRPCATYMAP